MLSSALRGIHPTLSISEPPRANAKNALWKRATSLQTKHARPCFLFQAGKRPKVACTHEVHRCSRLRPPLMIRPQSIAAPSGPESPFLLLSVKKYKPLASYHLWKYMAYHGENKNKILYIKKDWLTLLLPRCARSFLKRRWFPGVEWNSIFLAWSRLFNPNQSSVYQGASRMATSSVREPSLK